MATHAAKKRVELTASPREVLGHKVRHLRATGALPAVLYGKGQDSLALEVPLKDFERALKQAGESTLVFLSVAGQVYPTIIHDVARHPLSDQAIHADFYKVRLDEKIKAMVPVVFTGVSPAVKDLAAIFVRNINELEVEALPADLPHEIEVDISGLAAFNDQIQVKDLKVPSAHLTANPEAILATVQEPISEEELKAELAAPTTDVSAVEEIKPLEKPAEEGEEEAAPAAPAAPAK